MLGQAFGEIKRAGPADIMLKEAVQFRLEGGVRFRVLIGLFQLQNERHQGFSHEAAAMQAIKAAFIGAGAVGIGGVHVHKGCLSLCCCRF